MNTTNQSVISYNLSQKDDIDDIVSLMNRNTSNLNIAQPYSNNKLEIDFSPKTIEES